MKRLFLNDKNEHENYSTDDGDFEDDIDYCFNYNCHHLILNFSFE